MESNATPPPREFRPLPPVPTEVAPTEPFRPPRAEIVPLLLSSATLALLYLGLAATELMLAVPWDRGIEVSARSFQVLEQLTFALQFVASLLNILLPIGWCLWQLRAARNLRSFNGRRYRFSPLGTLGWYFVPVLNLFKPYQAMWEVFKASDPQVGLDDLAWQRPYSAPLIGCWWATFLAAQAMLLLTQALAPNTTPELLLYVLLLGAALLLHVAACLTAAAMIHTINRNQWRRAGLQLVGRRSTLDNGRPHQV